MLSQIDHIGIAVESIDQSIPFYRDILGLEEAGEDTVEAQGVRVAFFKLGDVMIELLEPTREDSPVAKFLAKRGAGVHHLAMRTEDIAEERQKLQSSIRLLSEAPVDGAHGKLITFLHPRDTGGVLFELTQRQKDQ